MATLTVRRCQLCTTPHRPTAILTQPAEVFEYPAKVPVNYKPEREFRKVIVGCRENRYIYAR